MEAKLKALGNILIEKCAHDFGFWPKENVIHLSNRFKVCQKINQNSHFVKLIALFLRNYNFEEAQFYKKAVLPT